MNAPLALGVAFTIVLTITALILAVIWGVRRLVRQQPASPLDATISPAVPVHEPWTGTVDDERLPWSSQQRALLAAATTAYARVCERILDGHGLDDDVLHRVAAVLADPDGAVSSGIPWTLEFTTTGQPVDVCSQCGGHGFLGGCMKCGKSG